MSESKTVTPGSLDKARFLALLNKMMEGEFIPLGMFMHDLNYVPALSEINWIFEFIESRAKAGNPYGEAVLGNLYMDGIGVVQNYEQGIEWIKKSAHKNNPCGQYFLAKLYLKGRGLPKDEMSGNLYLRLSAEQKYPPAIGELGIRSLEKKDEPPIMKEGLSLLRKSSDLGFGCASCRVADMYYNGENVESNKETAFQFYKKGYSQGCDDSEFELASMLSRGDGVVQDLLEAKKLLDHLSICNKLIPFSKETQEKLKQIIKETDEAISKMPPKITSSSTSSGEPTVPPPSQSSCLIS